MFGAVTCSSCGLRAAAADCNRGEARELFLGTHACCVTQTRQKMHEVKPATKDPHVHRVVNVYNDPNQLSQSSVSARATAGEKRY